MCNYIYPPSSNCCLIDDWLWQGLIMSLCTLIQDLGIYDILPEMCYKESRGGKKEVIELWNIKQKLMAIFPHSADGFKNLSGFFKVKVEFVAWL